MSHPVPPRLVLIAVMVLVGCSARPGAEPSETVTNVRKTGSNAGAGVAVPTPRPVSSVVPTWGLGGETPKPPASPPASQDATASATSSPDPAASATATPSGLAPAATGCDAPEPTAAPEFAAEGLGAYAGQRVPAGWSQAHPTEAQVTAAIAKVKADPAAWACFQKHHPGAATIFFRVTELSLATPAPRTVSGVTVVPASMALMVGSKTTVAGTVTYTDGSKDGAIVVTTDDPTIVALGTEPGEIVAVKAGAATLQVRAKADETKAATLTVTVR